VQTYMMSTNTVNEKVLDESINTRHAIYDTRFCSDYYRRLPNNRILWGGRVSLWSAPEDIAQAMLEDIFKIYPQLQGKILPEYAWSGKMCYAPHKMPQIGQMEKGYWYNTGYGGHGLAPTTVGAEIIATSIAGETEDYKLFAPFGVSYVGGSMGAYAAQLVYLWWKLRDKLDI